MHSDCFVCKGGVTTTVKNMSSLSRQPLLAVNLSFGGRGLAVRYWARVLQPLTIAVAQPPASMLPTCPRPGSGAHLDRWRRMWQPSQIKVKQGLPVVTESRGTRGDSGQGFFSGSNLGIELFDHLVQLRRLGAQTAPVIAVVVPLGAQLFNRFAELLDPGEIFELVHAPLVDV